MTNIAKVMIERLLRVVCSNHPQGEALLKSTPAQVRQRFGTHPLADAIADTREYLAGADESVEEMIERLVGDSPKADIAIHSIPVDDGVQVTVGVEVESRGRRIATVVGATYVDGVRLALAEILKQVGE